MSSERKSVLVTGAAGWIGRRVCQLLQERGIVVTAFNRAAGEGPWIQSFVGELNCFADPPDELRRLLEVTVAVVHCAGRAHRPVETPAEIEALERANVDGTRNLLRACHVMGVPRLVYVSTIAGYDWAKTSEAGKDEGALLRPVTAYARTKLEGERLVRESHLDWRIVRLATVFGVGDRANFAKLAGALKHGRFMMPGIGVARKSVMPVDLAAEVLVRLALIDEPRHRLMNGALSHTPTLQEICNAFSAECGFSQAHAVPLALLQAGALLGDLVAKLRPEFPLTTPALAKLTTSTVINPARLYETLPDFPRPTFAEALRSAAEFYRSV